MKVLREEGINTPMVWGSSRNWKIPGTEGNIFFNGRRAWESGAKELLQIISENMKAQ